MRTLHDEQPDVTLGECAARYVAALAYRSASRTSSGSSSSSTYGAREKTLPAAQQERPNVVAARAAFREAVATVPLEDFVFLDESGVNYPVSGALLWESRRFVER